MEKIVQSQLYCRNYCPFDFFKHWFLSLRQTEVNFCAYFRAHVHYHPSHDKTYWKTQSMRKLWSIFEKMLLELVVIFFIFLMLADFFLNETILGNSHNFNYYRYFFMCNYYSQNGNDLKILIGINSATVTISKLSKHFWFFFHFFMNCDYIYVW